MKIIKADDKKFKSFFRKLRQRGGTFSPELLSAVTRIIKEVAAKGDIALFKYTYKFDKYKLTPKTIEVSTKEKEEALVKVSPQDWEILKIGGGAHRKISSSSNQPGLVIKR